MKEKQLALSISMRRQVGLKTIAGVSLFDPSVDQLIRWGANDGPLTLGGQWWRLLTSMFLHGGLAHLAFNMWALLNIGPVAEHFFGRRGFFPLYCLAGLSGDFLSLLAHPYGTSVGASGAIFGLAGGIIVAALLRREKAVFQGRGVLRSFVVFVVFNLILGFADPVVDNAAHVGGLLCGAAFGTVVSLRVRSPLPSVRRIASVSFVFMAGLVFLFGSMAVAFPELERDEPGWGRSRFQDTAGMPSVRSALTPSLQIPTSERASERATANAVTDSIAALERSSSPRGDSIARMLRLGRLYLEAGHVPDAVALLDRATRAQSDDAAAWRLDGTANLEARQFDAAIGAFRHVTQLAPDDPEARYDLAYSALGRGRTRAANGDVAGARADFKLVIDLNADQNLTAVARQERESLP